MIHIVVPHFRAAGWLELNIYNLVSLADNKANFKIDIIEMSGAHTYSYYMGEDTQSHVYAPPEGAVGGAALPGALQYGVSLMPDAEITLLVDPDAVVLAKGWDTTLLRLFADPKMVCAGINPRTDNPNFADVPEWNWMAFRTAWWAEHVRTFNYSRIDIGHLFADAAAKCGRCGYKIYRWPMMSRPFAGRGATISGIESPFVFHAFYSSRRRLDETAKPERQWWLTADEERMAQEYCRTGVFPCPDAPPEMFPAPEIWPGVVV